MHADPSGHSPHSTLVLWVKGNQSWSPAPLKYEGGALGYPVECGGTERKLSEGESGGWREMFNLFGTLV